MSAPRFKQLLPAAGELDAPAFLNQLEFPAHPDRPHVITNFVISADGQASFDGRSAPLSDAGDRAMFHALRGRVDAILAGTNTMRLERYGRTLKDADARAARLAAGRSAEPLAVLISRSGQVPFEIPLFAEPEAQVIVFSPHPLAGQGWSSQTTPDAATVTEVRSKPDDTLATAMAALRREHGVELLLCEGGPTLFAALRAERLVDELFLTVAPKLVGGAAGLSLATGPAAAEPTQMTLRSVLDRKGTLFLRYVMTG